MKQLIWIFALSLLFVQCRKDCEDTSKTGALSLNFQGKYGSETLVLNKNYTYPDGTPMFLSNLRFFVSDITLISEDGKQETKLDYVGQVDFTQNHGEESTASKGETITIDDIKACSYSGIKIGLGIESEANQTVPSDYPATSILSNSSDYWMAWQSYIFIKVEGRADTTGNGIFDKSILYHTGLDEQFRTKELDVDFKIEEDGTTTINLNLDARAIFTSDARTFDLKTETFTHTNPAVTGSVELSYDIMSNFQEAITLK